MRVKRLQIMIEEDLDAALELQAREERTSKAALIRRYVRERLGSNAFPPLHEDPLWKFVGGSDAEPVADIDDFLYGPNAQP
jgi:hypothetical protein